MASFVPLFAPPPSETPPISSTPPDSSPPPPTSSPAPPESSPPPPPLPESSPPQPSPAANDSSSPPPPAPVESSPPLSPPPPPPPSSQTSPPGKGDSPSPPPPPPPPPPPHHQSSGHVVSPPPPTRSLTQASGNTSSTDSTSSGSNMLPLVIGIVAGTGLLLLVAVAALFFTCTRKKKKSQAPMYNGAQSRGNNGNGAEQYHHQNWPQLNGATSPNHHVVNVLPPPPGAGSWPAPPPPPPPPQLALSSSEMSSSNFSGPLGPVLPPPPPSVALGFNKSTFTLDELAVATAGFAQANLLGQGGFGFVHKGVLPNGKEIAVKSLKSGSGQGDKEFQAEVEIISRVHHRHLVSLVGYCIAGGRKILVYEFLPNNNLEVHLHDKARPPLDWASRLKIAIGSAKGLAYLHEDCHPRIIHRDVKTSNILLDFNFEAKVADFGLAKLNQDNFTHVSTRVMGTFGYLAPEYASSGKLTDKSDVFSFGVVLLELITGRRPVDNTDAYIDDSLVDWARPLCLKAVEDRSFDGLVDPRLENNYELEEMARMVACAAASIRHSAKRRPKMSQIVRALEGDVSLEDLNEGVKPGQSSNFGSSSGNYDGGSYAANMRRLKKTALDNQDYGSSDYEGTSEYGLDPSSSSDDSSHEISRKGSRLHPNP